MAVNIITDILIIFLFAIPLSMIANRLRFPSIVALVICGALIGPYGLGLIHDPHSIEMLAEIGVALLLFSIGLEFTPRHFLEVRFLALGSGALQIVLSIITIIIIGIFFDFPWQYSIVLGCAFALSSTAVVLNIFSQKNSLDTPHGRISTGILILQDFSVVAILAIMPLLAHKGEAANTLRVIITGVLQAGGLVAISLALGRFVLPYLFRQAMIAKSKELFLMMILLIALGMSWLAAQLNLPSAFGAFMAGMVVSQSEFRFHALSEISPFRYAFLSIFFVTIGMLFDGGFVIQNITLTVMIILLIVGGKSLISIIANLCINIPLGVAIIVGMSLGQIGEFSFLIVYTAREMGIIGITAYKLAIAAAVISIIITPFWIEIATPIAEKTKNLSLIPAWLRKGRQLGSHKSRLNDHAIICGFGPLGQTIGYMLEQAGIPYIVLELNPATVKNLKSKKRSAYLGDGASPELLYQSNVEKARLLAITAPDYMNIAAIIHQAKKINPNIPIITRTRFRSEVNDLYIAGADIVICEELESSVEMGAHALRMLAVPEKTIEDYLKQVRAFGSADFF